MTTLKQATAVLYLIFIHHNLGLLHMEVAVLVARQQAAMGLLHPTSLTQELRLILLGSVLLCTLQ